MAAPGVYYLSVPVLSMLCTILICAGMAYLVIPCVQKMGIQTNNLDQEQLTREKTIKDLQEAVDPILPSYGITWKDVED